KHRTPHRALRTAHRALRTPQSVPRTPHSTVHTPHSGLRTPNSALRTSRHSALRLDSDKVIGGAIEIEAESNQLAGREHNHLALSNPVADRCRRHGRSLSRRGLATRAPGRA